MTNWLRKLLQKWVDKMRYKVEHDVDKPVYNLGDIIKPSTELYQRTLENESTDQTKYIDF